MIILGITGSIGMGKSTASHILRSMGVPVHDSDHAVHKIFDPAHEGFAALCAAFPMQDYPDIYTKDALIDRRALGQMVFADPDERIKLESIIHPRVRADQEEFILKHQSLNMKVIALDIPLLFETGAERRVDYTIVVHAPPHIQKARVLERPGMSEERFNAILGTQMPNAEKCKKADFVVQTGLGLAYTTHELKQILLSIGHSND